MNTVRKTKNKQTSTEHGKITGGKSMPMDAKEWTQSHWGNLV